MRKRTRDAETDTKAVQQSIGARRTQNFRFGEFLFNVCEVVRDFATTRLRLRRRLPETYSTWCVSQRIFHASALFFSLQRFLLCFGSLHSRAASGDWKEKNQEENKGNDQRREMGSSWLRKVTTPFRRIWGAMISKLLPRRHKRGKTSKTNCITSWLGFPIEILF